MNRARGIEPVGGEAGDVVGALREHAAHCFFLQEIMADRFP
jgi:hypothetical protein